MASDVLAVSRKKRNGNVDCSICMSMIYCTFRRQVSNFPRPCLRKRSGTEVLNI